MIIIENRKYAFGLIECIDCIMGRVTRDVARRRFRSKNGVCYCKQSLFKIDIRDILDEIDMKQRLGKVLRSYILIHAQLNECSFE